MKVGNRIDFGRDVLQTKPAIEVGAYSDMQHVTGFLADVIYLRGNHFQRTGLPRVGIGPGLDQEPVERDYANDTVMLDDLFNDVIGQEAIAVAIFNLTQSIGMAGNDRSFENIQGLRVPPPNPCDLGQAQNPYPP